MIIAGDEHLKARSPQSKSKPCISFEANLIIAVTHRTRDKDVLKSLCEHE